MAQIVRHEFVGNKFLLVLLWITGIGIPLAVVYLIESTVTVEDQIEDATEFLEAFRAGKVGR